jgi:MipA family protein
VDIRCYKKDSTLYMNIRPTHAAVVLALLCAAPLAWGQDAAPRWRLSLGAQATHAPTYGGAASTDTSLRPIIGVSYGRFAFTTPGASALRAFDGAAPLAGASVSLTDPKSPWRLGLALRTESGLDRGADARLAGLSTQRATMRLQIAAGYRLAPRWSLSASIAPDLLGRNAGTSFALGLNHHQSLGPDWQLVGGLSLSGGDARFMQRFHGVTAADAASSGLATYSPGSGLRNWGLNIGLNHRLNAQWAAFARLNHGRLLGGAASSPLTQDSAQTSITLGAGYNF